MASKVKEYPHGYAAPTCSVCRRECLYTWKGLCNGCLPDLMPEVFVPERGRVGKPDGNLPDVRAAVRAGA